MIVIARAVALVWFSVIATPAFAQFSCLPPQELMLDLELLLGRGTASDARWRRFLDTEVTPRFPDGLTIYETTGRWRDPARNVTIHEKGRVLRIIARTDAAVQQKANAVAEAYRKQFREKSVGVVMRPACVSF